MFREEYSIWDKNLHVTPPPGDACVCVYVGGNKEDIILILT